MALPPIDIVRWPQFFTARPRRVELHQISIGDFSPAAAGFGTFAKI